MDKEAAFSGEGGLEVPGRWHHKGKKVLYCSQSLALCALEVLSNYGLSRASNYLQYSISISEDLIKRCQLDEFPEKWNAYPSIDTTRDFADRELFSSKKFLALAVPSSIIPEEYNLVINPSHSAYSKSKETIKELGEFNFPALSKIQKL